MKRKVYLLAACLLSLALAFVAGCKKDTPITDGGGDAVPSIVLSETTVSMNVYAQHTLTATTENLTGAVVWSSSDESVVTVDGGVLTALKEGTATVKAAVGETSAECAVTVAASTVLPFVTLDKDKVEIPVQGTLTVSASVSYDGASFESDFTFDTADHEIATVSSAGVVEGLKVGSTTLSVTTIWRGATLTESIDVAVKEVVSVSWDDEEDIELVTNDSFGGEKSVTVTPVVIENGTPVVSPSVTYTLEDEDGESVEDIVTVSDQGVLTAVGKEGVAYLSYTYTSAQGIPYTSSVITITCARPIVDIDAMDIELGVDGSNKQNTSVALTGSMFGIEGTITEVECDGDPLNVNGGTVSGVTHGTYEWVVYNSLGYGQRVQVTLVTLIISDATELQQMTAILEASMGDGDLIEDTANGYQYKNYHGYFILDDDINFGNARFASLQGARYDGSAPSHGFDGVFDGRGHTIKNIKFNRENISVGTQNSRTVKTGLFGALAFGGVVKNVNLTGVTLEATWAATIGSALFGKLENVSIEVVSMNASSDVISIYAYAGSEMHDTVVWLNLTTELTATNDGGAYFIKLAGEDYVGKFTNNYLINNKVTYTQIWSNNSTSVSKLTHSSNSCYVVGSIEWDDDSAITLDGDNTSATVSAKVSNKDGNEISAATITYKAVDSSGNESNLVTIKDGVITATGEGTGEVRIYAYILGSTYGTSAPITVTVS